MKRDLNSTAATPIIAAALRRGRRAQPRQEGKGRATQNPADNYVTEGRVTRRFHLEKCKKAGAKAGNFNAVAIPGRKPEDIALYHRIADVRRSAKSLVRAINRDLRQRRNEIERT